MDTLSWQLHKLNFFKGDPDNLIAYLRVIIDDYKENLDEEDFLNALENGFLPALEAVIEDMYDDEDYYEIEIEFEDDKE